MNILSFHDKQHVLRLLNQQGRIKRIFDDFTRRSGLILTKWTEKNTDNVWIRNATLEKKIDRLLEELHDNLLSDINNNTSGAWEASNLKNDDLIKAFIKDLALSEVVGKSKYEQLEKGMFTRNMEALKAFQQRTIDGLNTSQRVWKAVDGAKENLEYYLSSGISTGRPAVSIAQDVRQLLQDPGKRFRRIRNEEGKLILSKPMQDYHPGQGKYRSSYMNALRVAATETNIAYHAADYERWKDQGFVLGIEVFRSESNKGPCDVCDPMVGRYPKDYKFTGNHPWCICQAVPVMLEGEEFTDYLLTGKVPEDKIIKTIPQSALDYVNEKESRKDLLFVKENEQYFSTTENKPKIGKRVKTDAEKALIQQRWENRSVENFNQKRVEEKLGIKKGKAMDFMAANELRPNINYRTGEEYRVNCQSCVVAYELRRRGYDVTAQPNFKNEGIPERLSKQTNLAWINPKTITAPEINRVGLTVDRIGRVVGKSWKETWKELNAATKEVGRYHVGFAWKSSDSGHIITVERLENNLLKIYDPQNGSDKVWTKEYMKRISLSKSGLEILRVDDLLINTDIIDGIVTKLLKK